MNNKSKLGLLCGSSQFIRPVSLLSVLSINVRAGLTVSHRNSMRAIYNDVMKNSLSYTGSMREV